jgi:hypothetical protein
MVLKNPRVPSRSALRPRARRADCPRAHRHAEMFRRFQRLGTYRQRRGSLLALGRSRREEWIVACSHNPRPACQLVVPSPRLNARCCMHASTCQNPRSSDLDVQVLTRDLETAKVLFAGFFSTTCSRLSALDLRRGKTFSARVINIDGGELCTTPPHPTSGPARPTNHRSSLPRVVVRAALDAVFFCASEPRQSRLISARRSATRVKPQRR